MHKKKILPPAILLAASAIILIATVLLKDGIVIRYGIRTYGTIRNTLLAATVALAMLTATVLSHAVKADLEQKQPTDDQARKPLDETGRRKLYNELAVLGTRKWPGLDEVKQLLSQLDSVDQYQSELDRLLTQNDYLKQEPASIVQRVEDCMYANIKKLVNYMRVIQTRDIIRMREKARECVRKNAALLAKTDDFVMAVIGYVNGDLAPGEEEKTKDYVDNYMFVVLDAIDLPETYLK